MPTAPSCALSSRDVEGLHILQARPLRGHQVGPGLQVVQVQLLPLHFLFRQHRATKPQVGLARLD
jgi:hypothetical protein